MNCVSSQQNFDVIFFHPLSAVLARGFLRSQVLCSRQESLLDQSVLKGRLCCPLGEPLLSCTDPHRVIHRPLAFLHPAKSLRAGLLSNPPKALSVNKHHVHHQAQSIVYENITVSSCCCFPVAKMKNFQE